MLINTYYVMSLTSTCSCFRSYNVDGKKCAHTHHITFVKIELVELFPLVYITSSPDVLCARTVYPPFVFSDSIREVFQDLSISIPPSGVGSL
jgi:hypothetical protein